MNRSTWETILTALQAWQEINYNATDDYDRRLEERAYREAMAWLISVEPKTELSDLTDNTLIN